MPEDTIVQPTVITPGQTTSPPGPATKKIAVTDGDMPAPAAPPAEPVSETPLPTPTPELPPSPSAPVPPAGPLLANQPPAPEPPIPGPVQMTGAITSPPRPGDVPKFGELQPKIDAHPLFSGAKEPAPKRPRRGLKKLAWLVGILLAIAIALYLLVDSGVIKGASHLPFHVFKQPVATIIPAISPVANETTLKQTTYTNNKGDKFSTLFYRNPVTKAIPNSTDSGIELTSTLSISDRYPLTFFVESNSISDQTAMATYTQYKSCPSSAPLVLSAYNNHLKQTINVCDIPISNAPSGTNLQYIAFFENSSKIYAATFTQDVDWKAVLASPQTAATGLSKLGVQIYNNDIKTILTSVQPL